MDEATEARLDALLEAHERIAIDIGEDQMLSEEAHPKAQSQINGQREAINRIEEMIAEMVDDTDQ